MNKKTICGLAVLLSLTFFTGGTMALLTSEDTATNVITTGNIKIGIVETKDEDGQEVPFGNGAHIMPGGTRSKIVRVKNTGNHPAYIRVKVKSETIQEGILSCDFNERDWEKSGEYYYYKVVLEPQNITEPLFTEVTMKADAGNAYQEAAMDIEIIAYATQQENNGNSAVDAQGWPEE